MQSFSPQLITKIIDNLDLESTQNLRLTCRSLGDSIGRSLWSNLLIKYDYVSDVLPPTQPQNTITARHIMTISRYNITALMAYDNGRDCPVIADTLPQVKNIQIGGFAPPPPPSGIQESGTLLNKKFIDQLFERLIGHVIPEFATNLNQFSVVGNQYEYITETCPVYQLVSKTAAEAETGCSWNIDLPQTQHTAEFIYYAMQSPRLKSARIVIMADHDEWWLSDDDFLLPPNLSKLVVEADRPGVVKLQGACSNLFSQNTKLTDLTLSGLILDTKFFKEIPKSVKELTIAKCQIQGSETAKVTVEHLMLDKEQELSSAITMVANTLDRLDIRTVQLENIALTPTATS